MNWWDAPEYDWNPMFFPDRTAGKMRAITLHTDPKMVPQKNGQLRLVLINRHPHERVRVYCGDRQVARA